MMALSAAQAADIEKCFFDRADQRVEHTSVSRRIARRAHLLRDRVLNALGERANHDELATAR